jgi:hypothetical protein
MRVRLTTDVHSPDGEALATELEGYADDLTYHCACPHGAVCRIIVQEELDGNFDVIVVRSGYAPPPDGSWAVVRREQECRYVSSFWNPTAAVIASAISQLIMIPLVELF